MKQVRCISCNKLLIKIEPKGSAEIEMKCPRCGLKKIYKIETLEVQAI